MIVRMSQLSIRTPLKLARAPDVLLQLVRTGVRKRLRDLDYRSGDGTSGPFARIDLKITNACNLRCEMCGQWGDAGWHRNQTASFVHDTLPVALYDRLIDEVAPLRPWVAVWGGEPFLYRPLVPLLAHAKQKGLTLTVNTNGTMLAAHAEALVDIALDFLIVSIDGGRDIHDRVRGASGAFDKAMAGVAAVQAHKRARGAVKPFVFIGATVNSHNAARFDEVFEAAAAVDADCVTACYGWFQTEQSCHEHEALMASELATKPTSQRGWLWNYQAIDTDALVASVRRIRARKWPFSYLFIPELDDVDIPTYYRDHSRTFGYNRCLVPWSVVEILPNGDVTTCGDYPDYIVGNIRQSSILDLWNNDRFKKFRAVLQQRALPVCSRCCGLLAE